MSFTGPSTWFVLGLRGSAKSTFLEDVAMHYAEKGAAIFDLFGSRDGESLAWLRSPYAKDKKILLVKGENVDVQASYPVKRVDQVTLQDVENFDIIISASPLYLNPDQEFFDAARLTDLLYKRLHYKRLLYLVVREAANFWYSRLKICDSQIFAKANMIYLIREARHMGLALGLDSIRFYAIDIDIRNLSDYLILKSQGVLGLASDLEWLYYFFNPTVIRYMRPENFIMISRTGALGLGTFPYHDWHKVEKEDIVSQVGLKIEYGEELHEAEYRGSFKTVSDKEHSQMIELYLVDNLGMEKIAAKLGRSTRTPHEHIGSHNEAVARSGFCPVCKRAGSSCYDKQAVRHKA
jgi:hypothetical protein